MKPMESILGADGDDVRCSQTVHWFSGKNEKCVCGKTSKPPNKNVKTPIEEQRLLYRIREYEKANEELVKENSILQRKLKSVFLNTTLRY